MTYPFHLDDALELRGLRAAAAASLAAVGRAEARAAQTLAALLARQARKRAETAPTSPAEAFGDSRALNDAASLARRQGLLAVAEALGRPDLG